VAGINRHLTAPQRIADSNNGAGAASTAGHGKSAEYVGNLEAAAYSVAKQEVAVTYTETIGEKPTAAGTGVPIIVMTYSPPTPEGGITAPAAVIPMDGNPPAARRLPMET
jgi:hypothetical protein